MNWNTLTENEKKDKYEVYASHELNFYLLCRDRCFFDKVVVNELKLKYTKTFLDHFLLQDTNEVKKYASPKNLKDLNAFESLLLAATLNALDKTIPLLEDIFRDTVSTSFTSHRFFQALCMAEVQGGAGAGAGVWGGPSVARARAAPQMEQRRAPMMRQLSACMVMDDFDSPKAKKSKELFDSCDMDEMSDVSDDPFSMSSCDEEDDDIFCQQNQNDWNRDRDRIEKEVDLREKATRGKREKYKPLGKTKKLQERGYYKAKVDDASASRVSCSFFWLDFAKHLQARFQEAKGDKEAKVSTPADLLFQEGKGASGFLSKRLHEIGANRTECLFALTVLALPTRSDLDAQKKDIEDLSSLPTISYTPAGKANGVAAAVKWPAVIFHRDLRPKEGEDVGEDGVRDVLVAQTVRDANGDANKFLPADHEYVPQRAYLSKVIVTNVSSTRKELKLLTQIPVGSMPLNTPDQTTNTSLVIEPYSTHTTEFCFYFPAEGTFVQYPAHVSEAGKPVSWAETRKFMVVTRPSKVEKTWAHIVVSGTEDEVLKEMEGMNWKKNELSFMYYRLKSKSFYKGVLKLMRQRLYYDAAVWGYSFLHEDWDTAREVVEMAGIKSFGNGELNCTLARLSPEEELWFVHSEFDPFVEQRVHQFGARRKILNDGLRNHYIGFLNKLCYQRELSFNDKLLATYYLLTMSRDAEAVNMFNKACESNTANLEEEKSVFVQYLKAFIALKSGKIAQAKDICKKMESVENYHVERMRTRFEIIAQHAVAAGEVHEEGKSTKGKAECAMSVAPTLHMEAGEDNSISLRASNLSEDVNVSYYVMDIELLFSTSPFSVTSQHTGKFSFVLPTMSEHVPQKHLQLNSKGKKVKEGEEVTHLHKLPQQLHGSNLIVEVTAHGIRRNLPYFAHRMNVRVVESFGQLQVRSKDTGKPLSAAYVKVN